VSSTDVILKMLSDLYDQGCRVERNQRALRPVLDAFHRSQTLTEECLASVAFDAAQARHNGHRMNNVSQALATGVELLLDNAETKGASSDSIRAAKTAIHEALK